MTISENIILNARNQTRSALRQLESDARKAAGVMQKDFAGGAEKASMATGLLAKGIGAIVGGGLILAAGRQMVQFGRDSVQMASDVEESMSMAAAVFRNELGEVDRELGIFADLVNRSKYDLIGYAAAFQDTFVPLGFARDQAADLSVELAKLTTDLSSFKNIAESDVASRLSSALVGNHEAVRAFGVVLNETVLKEQMLKNGTADLTGAALEQAKVMARLQIIMNGTSDAHGDAARTADSYANVSRDLEAAIKDLSVTVGTELLPGLAAVKKEAAAGLRGFDQFAQLTFALKHAVEEGNLAWDKAIKLQWQVRMGAKTSGEALEDLQWILEHQSDSVQTVGKSYEEYVHEALDAAVASGRVGEAGKDLALELLLTGEATDGLSRQMGVMTRAAFEASQELDKVILKSGALKKEQQEAAPVIEQAALRLDEFVGIARRGQSDIEGAVTKMYGFAVAMGKANEAARLDRIKAVLDVLDSNVGSPIAAFIEDLEWFQAGGWRINVAFEALKTGLASGEITPAEADAWAKELFVATQDLQVDLNNISGSEAERNLRDTLGISLTEARAMINGTEGIQGALDALAATEYHIKIKFDYDNLPPNWGGGGGGSWPPGGGGGGGGGGAAAGGGGAKPGEERAKGFAQGAVNFEIPPGHPNDSWGPAWFSSGEVLNVNRKGGGGGETYINFDMPIIAAPGMDEMALAVMVRNQVVQGLARTLETSARAGAMYSGL